MTKPWQTYAHHILDSIAKIYHIQERENIVDDDICMMLLYETWKI